MDGRQAEEAAEGDTAAQAGQAEESESTEGEACEAMVEKVTPFWRVPHGHIRSGPITGRRP